ncbi:MAG: B12-binding domain-containing radical SAM protein [Candidatus Omnitrophica bacterium]|nr:B12-binding domain-containing radical SAM protein [Candidatus Omnitrophota bacterium]MBU4478028.1 B12-binding domain-containing radical SAM protein [Candidatus Omnitrophota bacterium]MCG2703636.1 B12-binding domain-containing radical SAM protein [Candidatus Omnitrophota bacterium]
MNIVIANSIGKDKNGFYIIHSPSRWSEGVRSEFHWFAYYPWELAYLSSLLKKNTRENVRLLDGCLMRLDRHAYYDCIIREKPDFLIMESATRMIEENVSLALDVKRKLGTKLVFAGQHASAFPERLLEQGIDYVCVGEYEYTVLELIQGKQKEAIPGLYPQPRRELLDVKRLPWPEDRDVSRLAYATPGEPSSEFSEIQMYASRGCPGACNFCVARHVYYEQPNWRPREVADVVKEIEYLKNKYPAMEGVFFDEEVHNANKRFMLELTAAIIAAGLDRLRFEAMCDVRFLDEEVLVAMKRAGYYKIRVGIETASDKVLQAINKNIDIDIIRRSLKTAKKVGLKTYGTFTFGALGSDKAEDEKTVDFIRELVSARLLDNLQLSICTPQPGTPFYHTAQAKGWLRPGISFEQFDGGTQAIISYPAYDSRSIEKMKNKALLVRDHYFLKVKSDFWGWVRSILRRYGIFGAFIKGLYRLKLEFKYQWIRWHR